MDRRSFIEGGTLAAAAMGSLGYAGVAAAAAARAPVVTGPVTGGKRGHPLASYPTDVGRFGYVEEEYFLSGVATSYRPTGSWSTMQGDTWTVTPDGKWTVEPVSTRPYKTRLLVHRPRDPASFNGTVLVEWINVSPGYDNLIVPADPLFDGFAYVGVSAQLVGVHGSPAMAPADRKGLTAWDKARYGSLVHPGDSYSFDIYAQAGRALKSTTGVSALGGLQVRKLVATGASQSAGRFRTYVNAMHHRDRVFDAYVPFLDYANAVGFGDETTLTEPLPGMKLPPRAPVRYRDDLDVPMIIVNTEQESINFRGERAFCSQPDTDRLRVWEVAGAPHSPSIPSDPVTRSLTARRDELVNPNPPPPRPGAKPGAQVTSWHCTVAAYFHMHNWLNGGAPPPHQPRLRFVEGPTAELIRDSLGIGTGGIRLPDTEVPTQMNTGLSDDPGVARNRGLSVPFTAQQLRQLYPTHEDYVRKVTAAALAAQSAGVIRAYRVKEYIAQAQAAPIPPA